MASNHGGGMRASGRRHIEHLAIATTDNCRVFIACDRDCGLGAVCVQIDGHTFLACGPVHDSTPSDVVDVIVDQVFDCLQSGELDEALVEELLKSLHD